jgi:hypothetical protein
MDAKDKRVNATVIEAKQIETSMAKQTHGGALI